MNPCARIGFDAHLPDLVLHGDGTGKDEVSNGCMERAELLDKFDGEEYNRDEQSEGDQTLFHGAPPSQHSSMPMTRVVAGSNIGAASESSNRSPVRSPK